MTTDATTAVDRLAKLGIQLPDAPRLWVAYVPAVQTGNLLFLSGMLATSGHCADSQKAGSRPSLRVRSVADVKSGIYSRPVSWQMCVYLI